MKKSLFTLLAVLVLTSLVLSGCGAQPQPAVPPAATRWPKSLRRPRPRPLSRRPSRRRAAAASEYTPATDKPMKIAFFVSDLSNVFHQGQATEAQKYAKDKYGAEVFIFDGKSDSATMTAERGPGRRPGHGCRHAAHLGLRDRPPPPSGRPGEGHRPDVVLQPAGRHRHPHGPQRRGGRLLRDGRRDGQAVEGRASRQADRDGAVGLAEPHRGQVRPYRSLRQGRPLR